MPLPRPLRPAEIRVLTALMQHSISHLRNGLAVEANVSPRAINRVFTSLKTMGLVGFDDRVDYAITAAGREALSAMLTVDVESKVTP